MGARANKKMRNALVRQLSAGVPEGSSSGYVRPFKDGYVIFAKGSTFVLRHEKPNRADRRQLGMRKIEQGSVADFLCDGAVEVTYAEAFDLFKAGQK